MSKAADETSILRLALEDAVAYLNLLPRSPATAAVISGLEGALLRASDARCLIEQTAAAYTPAGELLVKAELRDGKLLISTDLSQSRSVALWKGLSGDGLQLKMQPAPDCPARPKD
ncbi:MAG: hypothetical protein E2591_27300 [Achromobacter sp.]|uniref:hypothetical protein n=1 Tax=Achromobacter sp. TaxID=134375 RepID=UPI0012CEF870|nr:hypothetical protein [Achromobacter sp.]MPS81779.1 hypothetical protein [Achromobacter sp.]